MGFSDGIMSQVTQQGALTRLLVEKGIFTKEDLDQSYLCYNFLVEWY